MAKPSLLPPDVSPGPARKRKLTKEQKEDKKLYAAIQNGTEYERTDRQEKLLAEMKKRAFCSCSQPC